jgi:hypothetical protein
MSPTIVLKDGLPTLVIGSPGGSRIIGYVAEAIVAHIDWGMNVQAAVSTPHAINRFGTFDLEKGTSLENMVEPMEGTWLQGQIACFKFWSPCNFNHKRWSCWGCRSQTRRYSVGPITVSKQIWPTLHYADRSISSVIGKNFANFFGMLHLQSCFKKLTIF